MNRHERRRAKKKARTEADNPWREQDVLEVIVNPLYAGIHPQLPPTVSREQWIQGNLNAMDEVGCVRWMNTMLDQLAAFFSGNIPYGYTPPEGVDDSRSLTTIVFTAPDLDAPEHDQPSG